ncbi:MAG TPA: aminotransferase class I/II-fold pyridoxal phosphate-dependent enzyme [Pirellulaceae bacterium]|nr:aminotransferase class I/II-fold pyridoxal phosphate-dependent enzyme [Pirellulaceae bacterium]
MTTAPNGPDRSDLSERADRRDVSDRETASSPVDPIWVHGPSGLDFPTAPSTPPIVPTAVWRCSDPDQADAMLGGTTPGYVYQRDGHPNADWLADQGRLLHRAERCAITSSGMAALASIVLGLLRSGDRIVVSDQLYGRSTLLLTDEATRWGIASEAVDPTDLEATGRALERGAKLLVVETIANPRLRVAPLDALADLAHRAGALLVVDNTFATPLLCRPLDWGADLVYESVSKLMNGHGDLMLGLVAGANAHFARLTRAISTWGLASGPFDCWLAQRGLGTLGLRLERACRTAMRIARWSTGSAAIASVDYPGLPDHPDHRLAERLFAGRPDADSSFGQGGDEPAFGHVVTVHLRGGRRAAERLIRRLPEIPFCPSLGELRTTLSHPESTSHRGLSPEERARQGIGGGTIRLSLGVEPTAWVLDRWRAAVDSLDRDEGER